MQAQAYDWLDGLIGELTDQEWDTFKQEKYWVHGGKGQRDRLERVADWCAATMLGDLVEIGCYTGGTTVRLARIAQRYGRRVLAVDPWEPGTQDCKGGEYETFLRNMRPYLDVLEILRVSSLHQEARAAMAKRDLCFAYVDGLHTHDAALQDILSVGHAKVIAVDDVLWNAGVRRAFICGARRLGKVLVHSILCREGYLLSDDILDLE